jgi:hypothetical protein
VGLLVWKVGLLLGFLDLRSGVGSRRGFMDFRWDFSFRVSGIVFGYLW